jgi:hypothetical protein
MSRTNRKFMLRRAYEHFVATLGALAATSLLLVSVNAQATAPKAPLKASVTILVPTVTIEAVE